MGKAGCDGNSHPPMKRWVRWGLCLVCALMGGLLEHSVDQTHYLDRLLRMSPQELVREIGTATLIALVCALGHHLLHAAKTFAFGSQAGSER